MSLFTSFTSQSKIVYRIKNLNSTSGVPQQIQKSIRPIHVGQHGFQMVSGELSFTESRFSPLTISHHYRNQDLTDAKENGLMEMILQQNQESEFLRGNVSRIKDLRSLWRSPVFFYKKSLLPKARDYENPSWAPTTESGLDRGAP